MLTRIIHVSGAPAGLFNPVIDLGSHVGQTRVDHLGVSAISFTRSVPVGRGFAISAAQSMKKIQMEVGGKIQWLLWLTPIWISPSKPTLTVHFINRATLHGIFKISC
ncbi:MAG: aldehyde dehydrogenase family protein [Maricaulaceae bacterium]